MVLYINTYDKKRIFNCDIALEQVFIYLHLVVKPRMLFIRDNFLVVSDNEAGMETKTVLTYIPLHFCSTYI